LRFYGPPWRWGVDLDVELGRDVTGLASNTSGTRVAAALGKHYVVWDTTTWRPVMDVPEHDWGCSLGVAPDGTLAALGSREAISVVAVDDGQELANLAGHCSHLAIHPSNRWVVGAPAGGALHIAEIRPDAAWRILSVRGEHPNFAAFFATQTETLVRRAREEVVALARREGKTLGEAELAAARAAAERTVRENMAGFQAAAMAAHAERGESVVMLGFSADGRRLWCGTSAGLRVYDWDQVADADVMPEPVRQYSSDTGEIGSPQDYVYAAVEEPDGGGLLFGGTAGRLLRMDLGSGQVRELLRTPEEEAILSLSFSLDHRALGIVSTLRLRRARGKRDERDVWSIWSYDKLLAAAG
jgi:hypothetical protein